MENELVSGIYCIENLINNKKYIGQTKDIYDRWKTHLWQLRNNRHQNKYLQNSWNKYTEENFKFSIIEHCDVLDLNKLEIFYIKKLNTFYKENGYNLTYGGEGTTGHILSDESKIKIGLAQKGKEISQEHRNTLSLQFSGEGNPFYGIEHTDKTKKILSEKRILNGLSKGANNIKAKKVFCNGVIFDYAQACADFYKIKSCTLRSWIRGNRPMPEKFRKMNLSYV